MKSSAQEHVFRTYNQVRLCRGFYKDPEEWGWRKTYHRLEPIRNKADPAPVEL